MVSKLLNYSLQKCVLLLITLYIAILLVPAISVNITGTNQALLQRHSSLRYTSYNTYCKNQESSICDWIVVEAQITGADHLSSTGKGIATGNTYFGGICCVVSSCAVIEFGYYDRELGYYYYTRKTLELDGSSVSQSFYPSGDMMYTSVYTNWCDNVRPSVAATLDGLCLQ